MKGIIMSEQTQASATPAVPVTPATPTAPVPVTMPTQAATTPTTAATVDIEQLTSQAAAKATEAAEKKMEAVFKSMLQQNGMDADSINKMTAEWKSKQQTPEQAMQELTGTNQTLTGQVQDLQRQIAAISKGIPTDKAPKYLKLAESYLDKDGDFEKALDAALVDFPIPTQSAPTPAPAPQLPVGVSIFQQDGSRGGSTVVDPNLAAFAKGAGIDVAKIK